jgi:hypothetical protein
MKNNKKLIGIKILKNDNFNLISRIKKIDSGYFIVLKNGHYEVHNNKQRGSSYCLTYPYKQLDYRLIELINSTKFSYELMYKIDSRNKFIEENNERQVRENANEIMSEYLDYFSSTTKTFKECDIWTY